MANPPKKEVLVCMILNGMVWYWMCYGGPPAVVVTRVLDRGTIAPRRAKPSSTNNIIIYYTPYHTILYIMLINIISLHIVTHYLHIDDPLRM